MATDTVLAAVRTGPGETELHEFPWPQIPEDGAVMRVEVAGICGSDVKFYKSPPFASPVIMGHENVGTIVEAGPKFKRLNNCDEGDRVFLEHYVGCMHCEWCRRGQYRHCEMTDWRTNRKALRFGYTTSDNPYRLWGGFAQYLYLPWNSVIHRVPDAISDDLAGLVTPLSNGMEWALFEAGVTAGSTVLVQGPGQQGLSQVVASRTVGATQIIITGTGRDRARLELARELGADHTINVDVDDPLEVILDLTNGRGVDAVVDCTSGASVQPILLGIDALKRRGGVFVVQGEIEAFPGFPLKKMAEKGASIKSARGHSFWACELALEALATTTIPMERMTTHTFGLSEVDHAIKAVAGIVEEDVVHVSLLPWQAGS